MPAFHYAAFVIDRDGKRKRYVAKRCCQRCKKPLPASRYFNCSVCVDSNEWEGPFDGDAITANEYYKIARKLKAKGIA